MKPSEERVYSWPLVLTTLGLRLFGPPIILLSSFKTSGAHEIAVTRYTGMLTVCLVDSVYARTESAINRYTKHIHNTLSGFSGYAYGSLVSYVCNFPSSVQSACCSKYAAHVI
jgi:hypothetical protein